MLLMLTAVVSFALIGLTSRRFGLIQNALIATVSLGLVLVQFFYSRFL